MKWNLKEGDIIYAYMYKEHKYVYTELKVKEANFNDWYEQYIFEYDGKEIAFNFHRARWDMSVFCIDYATKETVFVTDPGYRYDIFAKSKNLLESYLKNLLEKQLKYINDEKKRIQNEEEEILNNLMNIES